MNGPALAVCRRQTGGANFHFQWQYGYYAEPKPDFSGSMVDHNTTQYDTAVDLGNGEYTIQYQPKYAGQIAATMFLDSVPLGATSVLGTGMSTLTINVLPTVMDAQTTYAYDIIQTNVNAIGGMEGGKAGLAYSFKIKTADVFNNMLTTGVGATGAQTTAFSVKFDSGSGLSWGTVFDDGNGEYTVTYTINQAGVYTCHVMLQDSNATYSAISNSPFITTIVAVPCPKIGDEEPCNGKGTCADTGECSCETGWDGDYCQEELAQFLRLAIIMENATILAVILTVCISIFWRRCVVEKQMFERLKYEDIEDDW